MNRTFAYLLVNLVASTSCYAADSLESDLFLELQQDMQHFSNLAIDTKQNVDYMPYVISTLNDRDLVKLGIINLREAIALIPGVDINIGMAGVKNPIFRGSNPYAFGQSRLIIDGIVVNDQIFGGYTQFLDMPVDLIHRIEVVRGPGSMLHHVNGFTGSIHVITKSNRDDGEATRDQAFVFTGSDNLTSAGMIRSFELDNGTLNADLYFQNHNLHLPVGDDRIPLPPSSGNTDQSLKNYQFGLNYQSDGLSLKARSSKNDSGVSYGQAFSLSDDDSDSLDISNNLIELKYTDKLTDKLSMELVLDYVNEDRKLQNKVMPDGAMVMLPPPPVALPDGRYLLIDYSEQILSQRIQLTVDFSASHKLHIGIQARQSEVIGNSALKSDDNLATLTLLPSGPNLFATDKRIMNTIYIEDMFDISDQTTVQFGGKLSDYNDVDNQSALRLALVHRYDDEHIYKAMFSQAYREPSWREQYLTAPAFFKPNPILQTEKVNAYELSYIRRMGHRDFFKLNTFLLQNDDQIDAQNASSTFNNSDSNDLYGFELEYESSFYTRGILHFNFSYIDGDNVTDALANSAQSLTKVYYLHRASEQWNYSALVKYTGKKDRVVLDSRDSVDAYTVMDFTASYQHHPASVKLNLTIKNAFDTSYDLPSPNGTYPGDFEQPGRSWLLRLSKDF